MSSCSTMPSLEVILDGWWGNQFYGYYGSGAWAWASPGVPNILTGVNPPFTATDLLAQYPNFGGIPTTLSGTLTNGAESITGLTIPANVNLLAGQLLVGPGIAPGATIATAPTETTTTQLNLSQPATATATEPLTFYNSVLVVPCNTYYGSTSVTNVVLPPGATITVGQLITGPSIPAGTTVAYVASATAFTLSAPATVTSAEVVTLYSPVAVINGTVTASSNIVTGITIPSNVTLTLNQPVTGTGVPAGTLLTMIATTTAASLTMSLPALQSGTVSFLVYTAPFVPLLVMVLYIQYAQACIFQARWCELWPLAMALFVAHFCQMFLLSQGQPASTAGQVAAAGLQTGILTSKSVDGVSGSYTNVLGADFEWGGTFQMTTYGAQLLTLANGIPRFSYAP